MTATLDTSRPAPPSRDVGPGPASWRALLAPWTVWASLLLTVLAVGGSLYEHVVVDPAWPANAAVIQPDHGGVDRKLFWIPLHGALTLVLPLALWASWRHAEARRWLLAATGSYVVMRVWTMVYFVPRALEFEAEGISDAAAAQTWVLLSTLRLPLVLASVTALWMAARRLDKEGPTN